MDAQLKQEAARWVTFLGLPDAHSIKGKSYCTLSALLIQMLVDSCTSEYGIEKLEQEIAKLTVAFKPVVVGGE